MLSFIRYLTEAKAKPDAMQRFADRALAGAQARVKQQDELLSPLASMNRDPKIDPRNGNPTAGTKYWYHPDSRNLVPVGIKGDHVEGDHGDTVMSSPDTFGITSKQLEKIKMDDDFDGPIHSAIRNGWVRLDSSGTGLTVQGTKAQAHKVVRDHYAATAGARPMYYVDHFMEGKVHGGWLQGAEHVQHYIDHAGTPPMSARWYQADFDSTND